MSGPWLLRLPTVRHPEPSIPLAEQRITVEYHGSIEPQEDCMDAEQLARLFHETYERLAPSFGYSTREASAKPWEDVPEQNRSLMIAVCAEVLEHLRRA